MVKFDQAIKASGSEEMAQAVSPSGGNKKGRRLLP
jgi:hypothetical protein